MTHTSITIIGTSHISKDSIKNIRNAFEDKPDFVCVELDPQRLFALTSKQKQTISLASIKHIGFKGFLFAVIGKVIQQKLGSVVGITPGADMLEAVKQSAKHKAKVCLVDRDLRITLKRFSKNITWKERFRFVWDLVKSPFDKKQRVKINLSKVPDKELIRFVLGTLKKRYPSVYKTLVDERNKFMARRILFLAKKNPGKKFLVVVGAGHEAGLKKYLDRMFKDEEKFEVV